jgi:hypothetical protein
MKKTAREYEDEARYCCRANNAIRWNKRDGLYRVFRRLPTGKLSLLASTASAERMAAAVRKHSGFSAADIAKFMQLRDMQDAAKPRKNPSRRNAADEAARFAERFHGRAPEPGETQRVKKPHFPAAMACIGEIYAIEYLAERDGKAYRFRHVFKQKSRPHLAVSPDGKNASMLGGAWFFGEDGFEDI